MKTYSVLFIVLLIGFVIAKAPAQLAQPYINAISPTPIQAMSGTLWAGSAQAEAIESITWQLHPVALLSGSIDADIQSQVDSDNFATAELTWSPSGQLQLNEIYAQLTTDELQKWLPNTPILAEGLMQLSAGRAFWTSFDPPLPATAQGLLTLKHIESMGVKLGDYSADFELNSGQIRADIASLQEASVEAQFTLTGDLNLVRVKGAARPLNADTRELFKQFNLPTRYDFTQAIPTGF